MAKKKNQHTGEKQRRGVQRLVCSVCGGEIRVDTTRSYPDWLAQYMRCTCCGRKVTRKVARKIVSL